MIELLKEIFTKQRFNVVSTLPNISNKAGDKALISGLIAYKSNPPEFYTILEIENLIFEEEYGFLVVKEAISKMDIFKAEHVKNNYLIFTYKSERFDLSEKERQMLYQIEENPYFFPKNVIHFEQQQLEDLTNDLASDQFKFDLTAYVEQMKFSDFKKNHLKPRSETLAMLLMVKLPFLDLAIHKRELPILQEEIDKKLQKSAGLFVLDQRMMKEVAVGEDFSCEEILQLFELPIRQEEDKS